MSQDNAVSVLEAPKRTNYRPKTSRKPQAIKTAVIAKRAQGETTTKIARDLGIAINTANGIIEQSGIEKILEGYKTESIGLIPEALRVARVRLAGNSEAMCVKVLENSIWPLDTKGNSSKMSGDTILQQTIQNLIMPASRAQETSEDKAIVVEVVDNKG